MGIEEAMAFTESEKAKIREHALQLGVSEEEALHRMAVALTHAVPGRDAQELERMTEETTH